MELSSHQMECLKSLIKFKINEKVVIKNNSSHDYDNRGKVGIINNYIALNHLEYYVEFENGQKCRYSLEELEKYKETECEDYKRVLQLILLDLSKADGSQIISSHVIDEIYKVLEKWESK